MTSTPTVRTPQAPQRIDINSSSELDRWSQALGVSREELVKVVEIAGDQSEDVTEYFQRYGSPGNTA